MIGRCMKHFESRSTGLCEWQCGCEDTPSHRLLHCRGTDALRAAAGVTEADVQRLLEMLRCAPECGLWVTDQKGESVPLGDTMGLETNSEKPERTTRDVPIQIGKPPRLNLPPVCWPFKEDPSQE